MTKDRLAALKAVSDVYLFIFIHSPPTKKAREIEKKKTRRINSTKDICIKICMASLVFEFFFCHVLCLLIACI